MENNSVVNANFSTILLRYLTTGNIIFDVIISSIVMSLFTNLSEKYMSLFSSIGNYFCTRFSVYSQLNLTGKLVITKSLNTKEYFSDNFKAVRHYIFSTLKTNRGIKNLQEVFLGIEDIYDKNKELFVTQNEYKFLPISNYMIEVYPGIYYKISEKKKRKDDDDKSVTMIECNYEISLYSKRGTDYILEFIEMCNKEYIVYIEKQCIPNLLFIRYENYDYDDVNTLDFTVYPFYSSKTFDTLYHENKEMIMRMIDTFQNNKQDYQKRGKPYNLGFIFHGSPGCGKTSTIKAIANYTQRHIVEISLSKVKTVRELEKLFFNTKFKKHNIPQSRLLYVLEDFDAETDILFSREYKFEKKQLKTNKKDDEDDEFENNNDKKLTLGSVLNILDGVLERNNQIIIFTTNYFDKLDKALVRPGRFDKIIEFKKANKENILEIYKTYYNEDITLEDNVSYKYTPSEIINMLQTSSKEEFLEKLKLN